MRLWVPLALASCLTLACATTWAADNEQVAEQFFSAGSAAYNRGDFRSAAEAFESAHRHAPRAATILNAARAWDAAKEPAPAADGYAAALRLGALSEEERQVAAARLAELRKSLGTVHLSGPAGSVVSVGHLNRVAVPATVYLSPGPYSVAVLFPSGDTRKTSLAVRLGEQGLQLAPQAPPAQRRPPRPPEDRIPEATQSPSQVTWGIVSLGAGAVLSGGAVVVGLKALDARDRYDSSDQRDLDARDEAKSLRLWTNVLWAGAAVAGGVGITLILTAPSSAQQHGLRLGPGNVAWSSQF